VPASSSVHLQRPTTSAPTIIKGVINRSGRRTTTPFNDNIAPQPKPNPVLPPKTVTIVEEDPSIVEACPPENLVPSLPPGYIGLERVNPYKRLCVAESKGFQFVQDYVDQGFSWILLLPDIAAACSWVQGLREQAPLSEKVPSSKNNAVHSSQGPGQPSTVVGPGSASTSPAPGSMPPMFMVGTDPNAGDDTRIFGIDVVDQNAIDQVLGPEGLPLGKDMIQLYERVMDVAALPSSSLGKTEENLVGMEMQETMEITALAISQAASAGKTGRALLFRSSRNNPLSKVTSEEDLLDLSNKVRGAAEDDLKTQTKQLRSFMHARGYSAEAIAQYVDFGGLPRLILRTIDLYKQLIETIIHAARNFNESTWKGSYAQTMVVHYAEKFASTRARSENYRDLVLDVYILLRDAAKKKFQDEAFNKAMWRRIEMMKQGMTSSTNDAGSVAESEGSNIGSSPRCGHCKHRLGHTTANCILKEFKAAHAEILLKNVTGRARAKTLVDKLKAAVTATDNDAAILAAITIVRSEVMG
jgi:hypothetical protein